MGLAEQYNRLGLELLWDADARPTLGRAFPAGNIHYAAAGRAAIEASEEVSVAAADMTAIQTRARETAISQLRSDLAGLDAQLKRRREQLRWCGHLPRRVRHERSRRFAKSHWPAPLREHIARRFRQ